MDRIHLTEKNVSSAIFQFILPISLKTKSEGALFSYLKDHCYDEFQLIQGLHENNLYGGVHVSHRKLNQYFPPSIKDILFPIRITQKGFHRFSKPVNKQAVFSSKKGKMAFQIHSIDVTVCPYDIVFLTIRTELKKVLFSDALQFASTIQKLEEASYECGGIIFSATRNFIIDFLFPGIVVFFENGSADCVKNTEVYVESHLSFKESETIDEVDVFRSGSLGGLGTDGKPYICANNLEYIKGYVNSRSYTAWEPECYCFAADYCLSLMTTEGKSAELKLSEQVYGAFYYTLLLNLFFKLVFLKIIQGYSKLKIESDQDGISKLIFMINTFTSNYFFVDYPFQMEGKELAKLLRKSFNIDAFYNTTKEILSTLFKYDENSVAKRDSLLLLILTLFTVLCGIFSMNLFTHDLVGKIKWSNFTKYNPFETFAVFIVFSGLVATFTLLLQSLYQGIINRKNRKKWFRQFFLGTKGRKKA